MRSGTLERFARYLNSHLQKTSNGEFEANGESTFIQIAAESCSDW